MGALVVWLLLDVGPGIHDSSVRIDRDGRILVGALAFDSVESVHAREALRDAARRKGDISVHLPDARSARALAAYRELRELLEEEGYGVMWLSVAGGGRARVTLRHGFPGYDR